MRSRIQNKHDKGEATYSRSVVHAGADILNNPRNNFYGRGSKYPQRIQLAPKHQSGEFQCSWEIKLCNSINLVVHVCKHKYSGVTGKVQGADCSETSDWEISADLLRKKKQGKMEKGGGGGEKWRKKKKENCKREGG